MLRSLVGSEMCIRDRATGVNRFLPPAIQPQPTGLVSTQGHPSVPPMPPMPNMPQMQPLVPQKTGPPPSIKFGVQPAKKLTPQPTGRANLANASKCYLATISSMLRVLQLPKTLLASNCIGIFATCYGGMETRFIFALLYMHVHKTCHCQLVAWKGGLDT